MKLNVISVNITFNYVYVLIILALKIFSNLHEGYTLQGWFSSYILADSVHPLVFGSRSIQPRLVTCAVKVSTRNLARRQVTEQFIYTINSSHCFCSTQVLLIRGSRFIHLGKCKASYNSLIRSRSFG